MVRLLFVLSIESKLFWREIFKKKKAYNGIGMQYANNLYMIRVHQNEKAWS